MGAAVPSDHFATSTANTRIGGSPFSWDGSFDDKNQYGPEKTGEPDAPAPQSLPSLDSPWLPPKLPPAFGETAVVLGPVGGRTNYVLLPALPANLRPLALPSHVIPVRPQVYQHIARRVAESRASSHQSRTANGADLVRLGGWRRRLGNERKLATSRGSSLSALARRAPARWASTRSPVILQLGPEPSGFRRHRSGVHG